jgi:hypothetical protein
MPWPAGTPEGHQPTFIAQTSPVAVDTERIAWHHPQQHERDGRELESFRQPHWDRDDQSTGLRVDPTEPVVAFAGAVPSPGPATHRSDWAGERERDDFAELRELLRSEAAQRKRTVAPEPSRETPDTGQPAPGRAPPVSRPASSRPASPLRATPSS